MQRSCLLSLDVLRHLAGVCSAHCLICVCVCQSIRSGEFLHDVQIGVASIKPLHICTAAVKSLLTVMALLQQKP